MLTKNHVKQVKWNQLITNEEKFVKVKEFLFDSTCYLSEEWVSFEKLC